MPRLVLIDGSSYLFRAFHALPPLTNGEGEPTGALFGVVNMLRATLKEQPDYAAFVVDASGPTFREALYPLYKANRPPMPDDLRSQVEPMCRIVEALGFPILRVAGVEADDVIGTLALQAAADGIDVTISTSDKDFAQLVREPAPGQGLVELVNTMTGSRLDSVDAVMAKFGVRPDQIIDMLALMGDSVDNIPGVPKCGPKTAAKWLAEHGSLDGVMAGAGGVKGKIGESLREALGQLPLSRQLATIKLDVALDARPQALALRERDVETLRELYARYGFNQALKELEGGSVADAAEKEPGRARGSGRYAAPASPDEPPPDPALAAPGSYETIFDAARLAAWIAELRQAGCFALDTETDSLDPLRANLIGISFAAVSGRAAYLPLGHDYPGVPAQLDRGAALEALRPLLEDEQVRKIGQHGKYDLHVFRRHGIDVRGYAEDTMLESFVLNSSQRHDMDSLARRLLGYDTVPYEAVAGKGAKQIPFNAVAIDDASGYAAEDADITLRLHGQLSARLAEVPSLQAAYRDIEMPPVPVPAGS